MFILVPAHPGCPEQNPESCKMVVVVVVVVMSLAAPPMIIHTQNLHSPNLGASTPGGRGHIRVNFYLIINTGV